MYIPVFDDRRKGHPVDALEIAKQAAAAAFDKKATRISVFDLRGISDICDFQVICSGDNIRQTQAIAENVGGRCKKMCGAAPMAVEGKQSGQWVLLDYGAVIVHIFCGELRDYYAIDDLWPKAKIIDVGAFNAPVVPL